jgi:hypothetical protein
MSSLLYGKSSPETVAEPAKQTPGKNRVSRSLVPGRLAFLPFCCSAFRDGIDRQPVFAERGTGIRAFTRASNFYSVTGSDRTSC